MRGSAVPQDLVTLYDIFVPAQDHHLLELHLMRRLEEGAQTYWVALCVALDVALKVQEAQKHGVPASAAGYYQTFGITQSSDDEARWVAAEQILPIGVIDWDDSTVSLVDVASLDADILKRSADWTRPGVWYRSGRIFFASEEE